jgi:hypothetical protein
MRYKINKLQLAGNNKLAKISRDANALLELLNEHEKTRVTMTLSRSIGGRANIKLKRFTIPLTQQARYGNDYMMYYVIHEFTHCLGFHKHDNKFKLKEQSLCNLFGYKLEYAKAYPKTIYANGKIVYKSKKGR